MFTKTSISTSTSIILVYGVLLRLLGRNAEAEEQFRVDLKPAYFGTEEKKLLSL